ncbi:hypothetical protein QTH90_03730 [Variovorax sp. J2P1-59]|uniref:hypothetical protein n=1 Tax=Variovorax flavidus TaxID=3053501 RepID=UPI00257879BD|nr:hypothetical protein [Variovorax sp. J2P1-59]MDM0073476.1 hypothetical protein [Variovorax sp. J2P1-59]
MLALFAPCLALAQADADLPPQRKTTPATPMKIATTKANHAGVELRYHVDAPSRPGASITVQLEFDGVTDPAGALVRLQADHGLRIGDPATTRTLPAGEATGWSIPLQHFGAGLRYLHVFTTQHGITSITSIPMPASSDASMPRSDGELKISGDDKIIALPVRP